MSTAYTSMIQSNLQLCVIYASMCRSRFPQSRWLSRQMPLNLHPLQWRHNGRDGVSNYQPHHCLLNHLFTCRSKKTSNIRVNGLCAGNSQETGEFPAQMASNAENIPIWWGHNDPRLYLIALYGRKKTWKVFRWKKVSYSDLDHSRVVVFESNPIRIIGLIEPLDHNWLNFQWCVTHSKLHPFSSKHNINTTHAAKLLREKQLNLALILASYRIIRIHVNASVVSFKINSLNSRTPSKDTSTVDSIQYAYGNDAIIHVNYHLERHWVYCETVISPPIVEKICSWVSL